MPVVDPRLAGKPVPKISRGAMERGHVARAAKARGAEIAFLDQRIPAYEREIINMVGMGVTENAELRPHVKAGAEGFSVTYIRAPKGCGAALHRIPTFRGDHEKTRQGRSKIRRQKTRCEIQSEVRR